jgi:Domain of unknown function (DUF6391)
MASSAFHSSQPGFLESEILDILFPPVPSPAQMTQDADLLRQLHFIPGLKELVMLRQVHALEHATVWMLSTLTRSPSSAVAPRNLLASPMVAVDNDSLSGMSTDRGFHLYGDVNTQDLSRAVQMALRRITHGESDLAVHPRCGTNLSVGMALTVGLVGVSLLLPRNPIEQLLGAGFAAMAAAHLTPELGSLAQRYLTTAIPFNLAIANITPTHNTMGRSSHFVEVRWVE